MNYRLLCGDALQTLRTLPAGSVHCIVTSPPYYGLRDYGVQGQIGLERTIDEYTARLVGVFDECRRVLRPDGTLWVNLGDSYANDAKWGGSTGDKHVAALHGSTGIGRTRRTTGLKPKELIGVPWLIAFALRNAGWLLRSDIVWCKPNPMPESVADRPTRAHEFLFLMANSQSYYYDAAAIAEPAKEHSRVFSGNQGQGWGNYAVAGQRNRRDVWTVAADGYAGAHFAVMPTRLIEPCILAGTSAWGCCPQCGAPWVRVSDKSPAFGWQPSCVCGCDGDVQPGDYDLIHSPTGDERPEDPSLRTGRAGYNRPRGEGEGSRPITRYEQRRYAAQLRNSPHRAAMESQAGGAFAHYLRTDRTGARPIPPDLLAEWIGCGWLARVHVPPLRGLPPVPCTVLDPFAGSGTTGVVALRLGRAFTGIDLNPQYIELAHRRIRHTQPGLPALA